MAPRMVADASHDCYPLDPVAARLDLLPPGSEDGLQPFRQRICADRRDAARVEAGADLIVVVCDPEPSPRAWELLADVRHLLTL